MNNQEQFEKIYSEFLKLEAIGYELEKYGIYIDESSMMSHVYGIFEIALDVLLTPEGVTLFYNQIIYQDYSVEEASHILKTHFL